MVGTSIYQISWAQVTFRVAVSYLCLISTVLCSPVMVTTPQEITSTVGSTVILPCQVQNVTLQTIQWYFVEHMTYLTSGKSIQVTEHNKYTIVEPIDSTSVHMSLQIRNLQISDDGHYRCFIKGTTVSVTHTLTIEGAPVVPTVTPPTANFTECCTQQNVSQTCLPVCVPSTVDQSTFDPLLSCANDLDKLLHCFSDGRNHAGCCRRRLVPDLCLDFCLDQPITLAVQYIQCFNSTNQIISCFQEGQILLPGPPTEVSVLSIPVNTLLVNWKSPLVNPITVTGYRIYHKLSLSNNYMASAVVSANSSQYLLTGLIGNEEYEVYVVAIGHHGSSMPSSRHKIMVLADAQTPNQTIDIQGCCMDKNVSPYCRVTLCHSSSWSQLNPNAIQTCYTELDPIFKCLAGGQNHTPCCERNQVPAPCLGLCSGSPPPLDWSLSQCIVGLHIIDACVQQGYKTLPSHPISPAVKKVTNTSAELEWSPPTSGSMDIKSYLIQLKEKGQQTFTSLEEVTSTYILLTDLKPSTEYEARIISVGDTASSLPSDSVIFLTYDTTYSTTLPPDTGIATIHNFTACCLENNISPQCSAGCSYDLQSLLSFYTSNILDCIGYLGQILTCASDGRSHVGCCTSRNVNPACMLFCNYTANSPDLDISHVGCIGHITDIIECYEEGVAYLPKHPVNVREVRVTTNTIVVAWDKAPTGPSVDHYILSYSADLLTWKRQNVTATSYILQSLKNNTEYKIEVQAVNENGTSPPSNRIIVTTDTGFVLPPPKINGTVVDGRVIWANRQECCKNHNISARCLPLCNGNAMVQNCIDDVGSILACSADGRDHRVCCARIGVPEGCQSICQGHITGKNFMTAACLGWTNLISGCVMGGAGIVPSEAQNFTVNVIGNNQVLVKWEKPANNCEVNSPCVYDLHYWRVSEEDRVTPIDGPEATTIKNVTSPYTLKSLSTFTHYRVTVTAQNMYGGSRHTTAQEVYVEFFGIEDIGISLMPEGILELGNPVKLFCDAVANPIPTITWKKSQKVVGSGRKLAIQSVKLDDSGLYTCEASNKDGSDSVTAFVPVMFKPRISNHRDAEVEPNKGVTAILACWFEGFPDVTTVKWRKNGKTISASPPKLKEYREVRSHTGVTAVQLRVYNVVSSDYGDYICKASNKYGTATGAVKLSDPTRAVTPLPTPQPKVTNVTACCLERDVDKDCMAACTFDVDIQAVLNNPALYKCALHIPEYAACAADGSDHSQCCKAEDVSDFCLPFCSGNVPNVENIMSDPAMLECVNHADKIIGCMEKNRDYVPNAPRVGAQLIDRNIEIQWSEPTKNGDKVSQYIVYFEAAGIPKEQHVLSSSFTKYKILNVRSRVTYTVWVVAANDYGKSHESVHVPVSVGDIPPQIPKNPFSEMVTSTSVNVRWSSPEGATSVSGYIVFYKKVDDEDFLKAHTNNMWMNLKLQPNSKYMAYVVAQNANGISSPSTIIYFKTGGSVASPSTASSGSSIGLGVGLAVLVIAIIAVVLLIIYVKFFRRGKGGGPTETVSFENPSYGRNQVQISGLPADATMQPANQFTYGRLEEDYAGMEKSERQLSDNQYTTISAPEGQLEVNGNNPATLPVTTDEIHIHTGGKNESTT